MTVEIIKNYMIYLQGTQPDCPNINQREEQENDIWSESPNWMRKDMESIFLPTEWNNILDSMEHRTCVAVTDGSFDPVSKLVIECWIIEGRTHKGRMKGASQTPGHRDHMDAYRAEVYGIYCILLYIHTVCHKFNMTTGAITIACNCDSAQFRVLKYQHRPTTSHPNYDLLWAIHDLQSVIPIKINYVEFKGQ